MDALQDLLAEGRELVKQELTESIQESVARIVKQVRLFNHGKTLVKELLGLSEVELAALDFTFSDGDDEKYPGIVLRAYESTLYCELLNYENCLPKKIRLHPNGIRPFTRIEPSRAALAHWLALARDEQWKRKAARKLQEQAFTRFCWYRAKVGKKVIDLRYFHSGDAEDAVVVYGVTEEGKNVRLSGNVVVEEMLVAKPEDLPDWAPVEVTPDGIEYRVPPEWVQRERH